MTPDTTLLVGCGRLGSAMLTGWLAAGMADRFAVLSPSDKPILKSARAQGADIAPNDDAVREARRVVLAVKPAVWRAVAADLAPRLAPDAVIVSVMAGVRAVDIAQAFDGRAVVRVMPTTGAAARRGVASVWSLDADARRAAVDLFAPIAATVALPDEALMDAATAVSGSGQAYFHALIEALARAGEAQGLTPEAANRLAAATLSSAAAVLESSGATPADLIAQVASPGGTTQAALDVFAADGALDSLVADAVAAAVRRAGELSRA